MSDVINKFQDGRLLVTQSEKLKNDYIGSGVPITLDDLRQIDKVVSINSDYEKYGVAIPLNEVKISGNVVFAVMKRGLCDADVSGFSMSGCAGMGTASGLTSGLKVVGELRSGGAMSGVITVDVVAIGY